MVGVYKSLQITVIRKINRYSDVDGAIAILLYSNILSSLGNLLLEEFNERVINDFTKYVEYEISCDHCGLVFET